ncbi:MAG: DoxX family membrane protein [Chloroflexi bacterium]|nr:DoxX family membrane protein [Chloroflexota bacterium]
MASPQARRPARRHRGGAARLPGQPLGRAGGLGPRDSDDRVLGHLHPSRPGAVRGAPGPRERGCPDRGAWFRPVSVQQLASRAVLLGEIAVGVGLILGLLTGIAAFFGALMNMSFLLAGSASTNPVMFTLAVGLMLAWKIAGYYGVDRYLLPRLGTPWRPGALFLRRNTRSTLR